MSLEARPRIFKEFETIMESINEEFIRYTERDPTMIWDMKGTIQEMSDADLERFGQKLDELNGCIQQLLEDELEMRWQAIREEQETRHPEKRKRGRARSGG
jgi:PAS domain-containing protein